MKAIGLNFSSNCTCAAFNCLKVPRSVAQVHFVQKQTMSKSVNTQFSPETQR